MLFFEVSSKTGKNVDSVFEEMVRHVYTCIESSSVDFSNEVKFIFKEIIRIVGLNWEDYIRKRLISIEDKLIKIIKERCC